MCDSYGKAMKKKCLSIEKKYQIIKDFESGIHIVKLAENYEVHHSSISRIISKKNMIKQQYETIINEGGNPKRTRYSERKDSRLEKCLIFWLKQKRSLGQPISGPILRGKALQYHKEINGDEPFKASDGWMTRFKERHGIRCVNMKGEKLSADVESGEAFKVDLNMLIKAHGYKLDNIYNADETGLEYRLLPQKTLAAGNEKQVFGRKPVKQRVTVLVCANASGRHKVPLLMIGNAVKPRCFKNVKELPIKYRAQKKAWMDKSLFMDWYKNIFIPSIKSVKPNNDEKFMLILDNAPSHPSVQELNAIDEQCHVFYLPPNVTSLMQPMDQGVISSLKRKYRELLLRELINQDILDMAGVTNFLSTWSLLNCCDSLYTAWENVTPDTLKNAWKKLVELPDTTEVTESSSINELLNHLPGGNVYSKEESERWVISDNNVSVCKEMTDDEILNCVAGLNLPVSENIVSDEEFLNNDDSTAQSVPPKSKVIAAVDTLHLWCRTRGSDVVNSQDANKLLKIKYQVMCCEEEESS